MKLALISLILAASLSIIYALQFDSSGYFTIVQFTDLHYGTYEAKDEQTQELQRNILSWVNPDLVIISGDGAWKPKKDRYKVDAGWFQTQWEKFTAPIVDAQIPYAYTFGNHDEDGDLDRKQIVQLDQTNAYSLRSVSEGIPDTANFRIPVWASQDSTQLAAHIWVLDSGAYSYGNAPDGYGWIENDAMEWYDEESKKVKQDHGSNVHHLAYFHIPLPEWLNVYNDEDFYGHSGEIICCSARNTGFFDRAKNNGDIQAMFVGHDHSNDFGGFYEGIELVYGRKGGYGTYGKMHGARVVKLKENYDANGDLYVTREHYVMDATGAIEYTTPTQQRQGKIQRKCKTFGSASSNSELLNGFQKIIFAIFIFFYFLV